MQGRLTRGLAVCAILLWAGPAWGQATQETTPAVSTAPASDETAVSRVRWQRRWHGIRWWEYAGTATFLTTAFTVYLAGPQPPPNWNGGVLFDDPVLRVIGKSGTPTGDVAEATSGALFFGAMGYRLVDSLMVPLVGYQDAELAHHMSMIDLSAFSVTALALWGSQLAVGRTRPRCEPEIGNEACGSGTSNVRRSFFAGHAATGFTAAGLTCTHHAYIPLYAGWGDPAACAISVLAAATNGVGRAVSESHYPSDVAIGVIVGSLSGWGVPALLHYGFDGSGPVISNDDSPLRFAVLPDVGEGRLGAQMRGAF